MTRRPSLTAILIVVAAVLVVVVVFSGCDWGTRATTRWPAPRLTDPTTVAIPTTGGTFNLDKGRDYRLAWPAAPVTRPVRINGGRNVVSMGAWIRIASDPNGGAALWANDWTGTLHLEGSRIDPGGARGIDLDAIRAVSDEPTRPILQVVNTWVDPVHGSYTAEHGDILQTWAGPHQVRIDRLTGFTDYQGLFLAPSHLSPDGFPLAEPWLIGSNIDLHMLDGQRRWSLHPAGYSGPVGWVLFQPSDQGYRPGEDSPKTWDLTRATADPGSEDSADASIRPLVGEWTRAVGLTVDPRTVGLGPAYQPLPAA